MRTIIKALLATLPIASLAVASPALANPTYLTEEWPTSALSNDELPGWPASNVLQGAGLAGNPVSPPGMISIRTNTAYSSGFFNTDDNDRGAWLAAWTTHGATKVASVVLHARMSNLDVPEGFPKSYWIAVTSPDNSAWTQLGLFTNQPDASGTVEIPMPGGLAETWGVWIWPQTLGTDTNANHYFQMAGVGFVEQLFEVTASPCFSCPPQNDFSEDMCYPPCNTGWYGIGPVCWSDGTMGPVSPQGRGTGFPATWIPSCTGAQFNQVGASPGFTW